MSTIHIGYNFYDSKLHVVPNEVISVSCMIGRVLLQQAELTVTASEVKLEKNCEEKLILNISVDEKRSC